MKSVFLLFILTIVNSFGQEIEFKTIQATKVGTINIDRTHADELLIEEHVLPEGKNYLVIIGEAIISGSKQVRLNSQDVSLGKIGTMAVGHLRPGNRGDFKFGYSGDLWEGKNLFNAIFIVDQELSKTQLNIGEQSFDIKNISEDPVLKIKIPDVELLDLDYVDTLSTNEVYSRSENQSYTKVIRPKSGVLLKTGIKLNFSDNVDYYQRKSFVFQPTFLQLRNSQGQLFNCVGTMGWGKFADGTTFNIMNAEELEQVATFIFNVPGKSEYSLLYLGEKILDLEL